MSLSRKLIQCMTRKFRAALPSRMDRKIRLHIADAFGISLAARHAMPMGQWVANALATGGSSGNCSVIGGKERMPPASAAFINSALGHMLDYDDMHDAARMHPTSVTLPSALAVAELTQASSDALVLAVAIGNELMCRLGLMLNPRGSGPGSNWFLTQLFGYFGSCMAAGIVLGLSEDELVSAFGLAYMQAAGGKEAGLGVDSNARSIYPAFAAMGGIHAILLAHSGLIGPPSAFDGTAGLFGLYFGMEPDAAAIKALLDEDNWFFEDAEIKPWPSCRMSHSYIVAAFAVKAQLRDAAIERVIVSVNRSAARLCLPMDVRCRPRTIQDAKHSLPFMTAFALVHGKVNLENLTEDALNDRAVLDVAARIEIAETLPDTPGNPPAQIEVHAGGTSVKSPDFSESMLKVSEVQIRDKFLACLSYCGERDKGPALWERVVGSGDIPIRDVFGAIPQLQCAADPPW